MNRLSFSLLNTTLFLTSLVSALSAQSPERRAGEYLLQFSPGAKPSDLFHRLPSAIPFPYSSKLVSKNLNVYLLRLEEPSNAGAVAEEWLLQQSEICGVYPNLNLEYRGGVIPNDPLFSKQWQFNNEGQNGGQPDADIDAVEAWSIARGGLTPAGDTIVVAVIDGGIQVSHPDLAPNLWRNYREKPGDGLDNDGNGFADDYRGWNAWTLNDNVEGNLTLHGTPVSAVIGARSDNGVGVGGVNWNVKIQFVVGGGTVDLILSAFDYILENRKLYNKTKGEKGAFVVAVNCSWGIDFGFPADAPLWCAALDSLGKAGIVPVAATANQPVDVDEKGDLPSTCPSDYLIVATALNNKNELAEKSAWGAKNVDLGAYGHEIFTAGSSGSYGWYSGTSFAAPQVAGAVALLYSAPCPSLITMAKINPSEAAKWTKNAVLKNVKENVGLDGKSLSGGCLNLYDLLLDYEENCNYCAPPFALKTGEIKETSVELTWTESPEVLSVNLVLKKKNSAEEFVFQNVHPGLLLSGLNPCTEYEIRMQSFCAQGTAGGWSNPYSFTTPGCCTLPENIEIAFIDDAKVSLSWPGQSASNGYLLLYKAKQAVVWKELINNSPYFLLENLSPCTPYQYKIRVLCPNLPALTSPVKEFVTTGCNACVDLAYCPVAVDFSNNEWIQSISLGNWQYSSGIAGAGYQNFANANIDYPEMPKGEKVPVEIIPGFLSLPYKQFFHLYIDFNADGDFSDVSEKAFDPGFAHDGPVGGWVYTPPDAVSGPTRMRVVMKFKNPANETPEPCESFEHGQIEDYCVYITEKVSSNNPEKMEKSAFVFPNPAVDFVRIEWPANLMEEGYKLSVFDAAGNKKGDFSPQNSEEIDLKKWPSGMYFFILYARDGSSRIIPVAKI